ncbi:MAG: hypothetical protein IPF62_08310 [Bacteroidetes bacterium]|nr:hypothetical protein [Bacteroidota bacterium]
MADFFSIMQNKKHFARIGFYSSFEEQLSHPPPLYKLAREIEWKTFDDSFAKHYSTKMGNPKHIRLDGPADLKTTS